MNAIDRDDAEKKIAEIRERHDRRNESGQRFAIFQGHAADDICFLLSELERKDEVIEEQKRELFYKSKEITELREKSWQDQQWFKQASANITEMQKELDREREENRKLREENRFQKKVIESYTRILHARAKDWERLFEEREMLIEGLRWLYQKIDAEHMEAHENDDFDTADILSGLCNDIRDTLKEIGAIAE